MIRATVEERFRRAAARRDPLRARAETTAYRLVNGEADGVPDVTVDRFEDVAVVSLYEAFAAEDEQLLADCAASVFAVRSVYLKRRPREARVVANTLKTEVAPEHAAAGEDVAQLDARENGLRFRIRPGQGLSVGLYLDMRDTRAWVRDRVRGKTVLNTFAYTCAFGVAALAGGASRAVNVDLSRRVLDWGEENARLNGFDPAHGDHLSGDVFEWFRRLARKAQQFDVVILDPPSFSTSKAGRFSAAKDYPHLVELAAPLVAPGGLLVACCNLATLEPGRFDEQVRAGAARRSVHHVARLGASAIDFPPVAGQPPALKVVVVELR